MEIEADAVDVGKALSDAAALEETGWRPGPLTEQLRWHPTNGLSGHASTAFTGEGAQHVGTRVTRARASGCGWHRLPDLVRAGQVRDGPSLTALSVWLALGDVDRRRSQPAPRSTTFGPSVFGGPVRERPGCGVAH